LPSYTQVSTVRRRVGGAAVVAVCCCWRHCAATHGVRRGAETGNGGMALQCRLVGKLDLEFKGAIDREGRLKRRLLPSASSCLVPCAAAPKTQTRNRSPPDGPEPNPLASPRLHCALLPFRIQKCRFVFALFAKLKFR
jgi:hypothetical protein